MNRIMSMALCGILVLSLAACNSSVGRIAVKTPVYPDSISFDDFDGRRAVRESNPIEDSYIEALNHFSYETASKILNGQSGNLTYSPISLYMALSIAGIGANGNTQDEIFSVLGIGGKGADYLSQQNSNFFRLLYSDNEIGKLKIANSLWLQKGAGFKTSFIDNAVRNFYASLYNVDFSDEKTAQLMGKWISENTNGILSPEVKLNKEQIMAIINTIYFKDEWIDRFNKDDTKPDIFHLEDGSEVECDFMNKTYSVHGFIKGEGFTSSSLSLKNSGSMIFILPDEGISVNELLSTPEKVALLFNEDEGESGKVIFKIPKFSFGSKISLDGILKSMGIVSAFEKNADFTNITDDIAFISSISQNTHIAIDEKGIEAAAFTRIDYSGSAQPNEKVAEMILDRPFIFAIRSREGALLFIGIVNNPLDV